MTWLTPIQAKTYRNQSPLTRLTRLRLEPLEERRLLSTCHVTRLTDQGIGKGFRGDLRYCINKVNAEPGPDAIDFTVTGTINLAWALPSLASDISIQGPGVDLLMVRRDTGGNYRIFNVLFGSTVEINNLTVSNGRVFGSNNAFGGGVRNDGTLTLRGCVVEKSTVLATFFGYGGGIHNAGDLTLIDTILKGNAVTASASVGGGLHNTGTAAVYSSTITDNDATLFFDEAGAGGGLANAGTMVVLNSTIALNRSRYGRGGGVFGYNSLTVISHSTIAGNSVYEEGGGIALNTASDLLFLRNTIVAGNLVSNPKSAPDDIFGVLSSSGHNLIGNTQGGSGFDPNTDLLNVDPMLGALADNGGPTLTMALLPGSPAIDAGDNTDAPEFDQRGPGFPRIVNGTIDIGAFEVQASPVTPLTHRPDFLALVLATADLDSLT